MFALGRAKPRYCLKIGPHSLGWGEHYRTWRGRHRYRCLLSPTPIGSIKLSPIELNLTDRSAVEERLRSLAGPAKRFQIAGRMLLPELPRSITLLLPDLAVRTTLIALDHLPPRREELEALIRWRLGQEQRLPLAGTRLSWQVFPASQSGEGGSHIVLVVVIQDGILAQYESICESVGLLPQEVGVTSSYLFNLWVKAAGGHKRFGGDLAWITVLDGALTCFIFHHGRPVFVRTKLLPEDGAHSTEDSVDADGKILREIAASFLACRENYPDVQVKELVLMTNEVNTHLEEVLGNELGVTVDRLAWNHINALGWKHGGGSTSIAALPVVAGMV